MYPGEQVATVPNLLPLVFAFLIRQPRAILLIGSNITLFATTLPVATSCVDSNQTVRTFWTANCFQDHYSTDLRDPEYACGGVFAVILSAYATCHKRSGSLTPTEEVHAAAGNITTDLLKTDVIAVPA